MSEPIEIGYLEALDLLEARGESQGGLRAACETSAKRDAYRRLAIRLAGGHAPEPEPEPKPEPKAPRPKPPPLATRARSLGKSVARFVAEGMPLATPEEYERRRAICLACELYDPEKDRCLKCGCGLKAKPRMATEKCPIGKW